jgi:hypothetical protein
MGESGACYCIASVIISQYQVALSLHVTEKFVTLVLAIVYSVFEVMPMNPDPGVSMPMLDSRIEACDNACVRV